MASHITAWPTMSATPLLETLEGETGPNPGATVIVLHGLGADGNDFVPICEELDLDAVGAVRFIFPNAPVRPVTINGGYRMRAWYDVLGTETQRREDEPGLRASLAAVTRASIASAAMVLLRGLSNMLL